MYLESLEMQGFKSFPDKIKLDFHKGLTAVVGPNGSGKSNIGDAVRWVLGEQSTKNLRGSKMEDVIFSGTTQRKAVGFAQVTLNIVNNRGILQIPSDRVSVTRKLYRSGESEYMINGSNVRLKDIYELFMDTGLGRDGYSIIGQGRVAEIVSAKSGERREIFEEAAGISKFRYKKAEAERRLAAAQENILRLRDILGELESRVEPLRIQSEKAAQFIELSEKKKELDITVWVKQLDDLKQRLSDLSD
ncbi:MAG: AAA family ATPase, partial [Oscillospiraceae bacterium]|nr:AAA family ATPase [Oscillospiraceae bacterium]